MTWRHWFGVLIVIAVVAFITAFSRVEAQDRLFTPEGYVDPVVMDVLMPRLIADCGITQ